MDFSALMTIGVIVVVGLLGALVVTGRRSHPRRGARSLGRSDHSGTVGVWGGGSSDDGGGHSGGGSCGAGDGGGD